MNKSKNRRGTIANPVVVEKRKVKHGAVLKVIDDGRAKTRMATVHYMDGKKESYCNFIIFAQMPDGSIRRTIEYHGGLMTKLNLIRVVSDTLQELIDSHIDRMFELIDKKPEPKVKKK